MQKEKGEKEIADNEAALNELNFQQIKGDIAKKTPDEQQDNIEALRILIVKETLETQQLADEADAELKKA